MDAEPLQKPTEVTWLYKVNEDFWELCGLICVCIPYPKQGSSLAHLMVFPQDIYVAISSSGDAEMKERRGMNKRSVAGEKEDKS